VRGDICPICCGSEREQTVHCPLDCEYLQESRRHEKLPDVDPDAFPHRDIRISEDFLRENESLLVYCAVALMTAALEIPDTLDSDVKEALEALVRTYRTLQSGLYYEARPANPIAAAVFEQMQARIDDFRKHAAEHAGMPVVRDSAVLGVLAFLQRLEIQHNNGRRLGRAFIDFLRMQFPKTSAGNLQPSLIV
jgi:hypothetical protein